jgi:hypothetical protein
MRDGVNVRRLPNRLIRLQTTLRVDKMRGKDGVDQRRLSQSRLACPPNKIIHKCHEISRRSGGAIQRVSGHQISIMR